ncbi:MAG TPA: dTDP-4-dehydrorhamnose 3,5-epimerase family protein [Polyangiales bacterium]|nr:dTDP-4-dehydrorhamnose 3,5-epimerase family protein [Polyangiales bacterium]
MEQRKDTIEGVVVAPRRQIVDERGKVMHALKNTDPEFETIGEVYFSCVNPGAIKAWHLHLEMTLQYVCVSGSIKLVLFDDRDGSSTRGRVMEIFLGPDSYQLVKIPPGVWNGFKGVAVTPSIVCNCATIPHRADEIIRKDPFSPDIPYDWALKHG